MPEETPIEQIINAGVKKVTVDGQSTEFHSLEELNKQRRRADSTTHKRRPIVANINLSGT